MQWHYTGLNKASTSQWCIHACLSLESLTGCKVPQLAGTLKNHLLIRTNYSEEKSSPSSSLCPNDQPMCHHLVKNIPDHLEMAL